MFNKLKKVKELIKFGVTPIYSSYKDRNFRMRTYFATCYEYNKLDESMILYESYHGKNATCNAYAMFLELSSSPKFKNFTHVWCLNDTKSESAQELKKFKNVKVIKRETLEYVRYLTKAKYLINNTSFPSYFHKKEGQVYINTWHGTPLKTIGADVKGSAIHAHGNIQHNLLMTDYLVAPNRFSADKLLESNHVNGIFNGKIVDAGYPRIDLTFKSNMSDMKKLLNVDENKKVILYAPTWRDSDNHNPVQASEDVYQLFKNLKEKFEGEYEVLLKVHYFVYKNFKEKGLEKFCVPDWIDTNELMSAVDILITDYSSIFFDFLHTKKPVLFFTYDLEKYADERGVYMDFEDLPGPLCRNVAEITDSVENIEVVHSRYQEKYQKMIDLYCYNDDGNATNRVLDIIFENKQDEFVYEENNQKTKILFWGGGITTNGITMSLLSLLNNIDYSKYDVTVVFASQLNQAVLGNLKKFNPNARIIFRGATLNYRIFEFYAHKLVMYFGLGRKWVQKISPKKLYQREFDRVFGNAKFDIAIDYCGYTPLWTMIFAYSQLNTKNIYLHSDMLADSNRNHKFKRNFDVIFNLYPYFDKLVSVAEDTTEINRKNLEKYGVKDKIVNVDNALDYKRVLEHIDTVETQTLYDKEYLLFENKVENGTVSLHGVLMPDKENVNFVTLGRLSPEKDHEKLIKAFFKVNQSYPNTKLYIIGNGELRNRLATLIKDLGLEEKVILAGQMDNPFTLMNNCDCFVMSSNYEGQGLAVLEALILKKHVISTDIPGPRGILQEGYGQLVENSEEGLFEGMKHYILEGSQFKKFDYVDYNQHAMDTFYKEICEPKS